MFKIKTMRSKYFLKCWPFQPPAVIYCVILEPDRTFKQNIFCKQWFSEEITFLKTSSYENNKICKYNLNLWQNKLDNNVMILSAKFADIKVSNFLIETRLDACEYSNETIFLKRKLIGLEVNDTALMVTFCP